MATQTPIKKKICWNCEGNVPREALNCPFCAVYLNREDDERFAFEEDEESAPPFQIKSDHAEQNTEKSDSEAAYLYSENNQKKMKTNGLKHYFSFPGWKGASFSLLLLMSGMLFLLFGFLLTVFSEHGFLILKWNAQYSCLYLVFSVPLLILGWSILKNSDE